LTVNFQAGKTLELGRIVQGRRLEIRRAEDYCLWLFLLFPKL